MEVAESWMGPGAIASVRDPAPRRAIGGVSCLSLALRRLRLGGGGVSGAATRHWLLSILPPPEGPLPTPASGGAARGVNHGRSSSSLAPVRYVTAPPVCVGGGGAGGVSSWYSVTTSLHAQRLIRARGGA